MIISAFSLDLLFPYAWGETKIESYVVIRGGDGVLLLLGQSMKIHVCSFILIFVNLRVHYSVLQLKEYPNFEYLYNWVDISSTMSQ